MGLQQLVYLCDRRAVAARALLALFNDPGCYVPFAATAINFTQFVLSMLCEGLLDKRIYAHHRGVGGGNGDGSIKGGGHGGSSILGLGLGDGSLHAAAALVELHELFCDLFLRFGEEVWRRQRPAAGGIGVMAFPPLFNAFKEETRRAIEAEA